MIVIRYTYATEIIRIAKTQDDRLGYVDQFEFNVSLLDIDHELRNFYQLFRRRGHVDRLINGADLRWVALTEETEYEFDILRTMVEEHIEGFVRRVARQSVLA